MTLNQKYRQSGTAKSFKDWVFEQQTLGNLDLSYNGLEQSLVETTSKKPKQTYANSILIGIGLLGLICFITRKVNK